MPLLMVGIKQVRQIKMVIFIMLLSTIYQRKISDNPKLEHGNTSIAQRRLTIVLGIN
jgi:hypothetical protein